MNTSLEELVENFSLFDDWEERYRYLIDIGRSLPHLPEGQRTDEYLVRGCTSQVWMLADIEDDIFNLKADSDAHIVRGLVAILMAAFDGKTLDQARAVDIDSAFKDIGLDQHLSANRRSGFTAMVGRISALLEQT